MSTVIETLERAQLRRVPRFAAGDRVRVHFQVIEGTRRRTQVFEGVVIKRQGHGARETFTVRKQSFGVGVERTFPVHSPKIEKIEVAARGDVRRAKLYYLRDRVGKRARVRERRYIGPEEVVEPGLLNDPSPPLEAEAAADAARRSTPAGEAAEDVADAGGAADTAGRARGRGDGDGRRGRGAPQRRRRDGRPRPPATSRGRRRRRREDEAEVGRRLAASSSSSSSPSRSASRSASRRSSSSRTGSRASRWSRRSRSASACSSTASATASATPTVGDIVVFHPPTGAGDRTRAATRNRARAQPCAAPTQRARPT